MKAKSKQSKHGQAFGPGAAVAVRPRKISFIHLFLALSLGLSACSQPRPSVEPTTTPTPAQSLGQETTAPETTAPVEEKAVEVGEVEAEDAVITFAGGAYERGLYEPLIEDFNKQYAPLSVQFVELPEYTSPSDMPENYFRAQASAADTSMIYSGAPEIGQYYRDLQPLMEADPAFDIDDFWPSLLDGCVDSEGRLVGVPLNAGINGIFYDKAAFAEAGLPQPGPDWTFDDMRKAIAALARKEGDSIRYGLAEQGQLYGSLLGPVVDAHLLDTDGEPDAETLLEAIQWYVDLVEQEAIYTFTDTENWDRQWQDWQNLFTGKTPPAMWVGELASYLPGAEWSSSETDPFANSALAQYDIAPFPVAADGSITYTTPIWTQCVGISSGSEHPRAAWTWLNFLSRQSLVRDRTQAYEVSRIPARKSVTESSGYWDTLPDKAEPAVRYALEHAWFNTFYPQAFGAVTGAMNKLLSGQGDFTEALASALADYAATPQPTPDTAAVVVATPRPTLSADMQVVNFFYNIWGEGSTKLKAEIEAYQQEHPGVAIELDTDFSSTPPDDMVAFLASQYDCFIWYPFYGEDNQPTDLLNLNTFFQAEGADFTEDFNPALFEGFRFEGELYGLPAFSQPQVMAYNRDLLEKRGLEIPGMDWTFDDFLRLIAGVASTKAGDESYGYLTSQWEDLLLRGRGVQAFDLTQEPPVANFDSPEMLSAIQWLLEQKETNAILLQTEDDWATAQEAINNGKLAFWSSQAGAETEMLYGPGGAPSFEVGALPMPAMPDSAGFINWASTTGYFISKQAQDPQACWDWIRYLSDQAEAFNGIPARRSLAESSNWEALVGADKAEAYRTALERVKPQPDQPMSSIGWPFMSWQSEAVTAALKGDDLGQALVEAQEKAEAYLACMAGVDTSGLSAEEMFEQGRTCAEQVDPNGRW